MSRILLNKCLLLISALALISCGSHNHELTYKDKAEIMFQKVWNSYRIYEKGLFSEYYPSKYRTNLTYFNDSVHQVQEVSYLWPMSGVFSSVVALASIDRDYLPYVDSMAAAVEQYYDTTRVPFGYQAYPLQYGIVDRYYDDNGLVGIDYVNAYQLTKNYQYLEKAKQVMTFILSGWDEKFDGGVSWLEGVKDQKPACSNGKALVLLVKLYEATGDEYYLETGKRFYEWINRHLRDSVNNVVWNSLSTISGTPSKDLYTYNTGTLIQGAIALYKATGESRYLEDAKALSEGSFKYFLKYTDEGIPYINDVPWFNLVLFRGYEDYYDVTGEKKYADALIKSLNNAWENARDTSGLFYYDWTGREDEAVKPKWLLDEACIPEFYVRAFKIDQQIKEK